MPLYALLYLFIFFLFSFGSTYMHFEEGRSIFFVLAEALSNVILISFVVIYYNIEQFDIPALTIIAMIIYTLIWEFYAITQDMKTAKLQFGIKGKELGLYTAITLLFILPTYIAGFAIIL